MVCLYTCLKFSLIYTTLLKKGYSKKSPLKVCVCVCGEGGGVEEKLSCNFYIFHFTPLKEIPEKTSFHHWKFCKIVWHPLDLDPHRNSAWVFLIPFFFNWHPWRNEYIHILFLQLSQKLHALQQTLQPCKVLSLENLAKKLLKTWRFSENPEVFSGLPLCGNKFKSTLNKISYG